MCPNYKVVVNPITKQEFMAPCRKCTVCRISKLGFTEQLCNFETLYQYRKGNHSSFITLTLRDGNISHCGLCRSQYTRFLDNFRINLKRRFNKSYKYIGCAEYGDDTFRPHYHFCFFGVNPAEADSILHDIWSHSIFDVGYLSSGGVRYVLDYIMTNSNKLTDTNNQYYLNLGLCPPFYTKSGGIGQIYLEQTIIPFYREHGYYLDNGRKKLLSSYYTTKYGLKSDTSVIDVVNADVAELKIKALQTRYRSKGRPFESFHLTSLTKEYYNFLNKRFL